MNRGRYALYILARLAEALAIALGAGLLAHILQRSGRLAAFDWAALRRLAGGNPRARAALAWASWWTWPAGWAVLAHLVLGPKQRRPVYRKIPGSMYAYAGVAVDRGAGCRGGIITGSTGSGKTLACIMPRLHSICVNEAGIERPGWDESRARRELEAQRLKRRAHALEALGRAGRLNALRRTAVGDRPPSAGSCGALREIDAQLARIRHECERVDSEFRAASDACRQLRYRVPPWGGFICGEKGNEWQAVEALLRHHGREEDLCVIRTRPAGSARGWTPPVRFNLMSMDEVPADTYAKIIVDTGLSVEEAAARDEFFVPQARDKIAWGIRLTRAVECAAAKAPAGTGPSLLTLLDILTVQESYRRYLVRCAAENPLLPDSGAFREARYQLENNYWNQPPDQLGGVRSTLYNFLVPFSEPEIAEVFCSDSTFDLRDVQRGKVVCLAIPQKFAVQRRYVATLMKTLAYQVILQRFDLNRSQPEWLDRNVILVEQDEWQRHAVRADCEADVVREAQGAVYASTQSQNAVWAKLGGRESAAPVIANLRNRWICQAATEECADESSNLAGRRISREVSFSTSHGGRTTNVSFPERPFLPTRELRALPPFHVIFVPAEGRWLYRKCIAMPATADGRIPHWWFGDWNPLRWAGHFLGSPGLFTQGGTSPDRAPVPPWCASAPLRAMVRWLLGLDGTFIIIGGMRARAAARTPFESPK